MRRPYDGDLSVSSEFGSRRFQLWDGSWYEDYHTGIDIAGRFRVKSASRGTVIQVFKDGIDRKGELVDGTPANFIKIDHGNGLQTYYWHLETVEVNVGQVVEEGQELGWSGRTGMATGTHLHFEVRLNGYGVNPRNYISFDFNLPITNNDMETVTVQPGWGLSNVALSAGLPANEASYLAIYNLNQGHRGSTDWQSLNARMGAGDVLRVKASPIVAGPVVPQAVKETPEYKELERKLAEAEQTRQSTLAEKEKFYTDKLSDLSTKLSTLEIDITTGKQEYEESLKKLTEEFNATTLAKSTEIESTKKLLEEFRKAQTVDLGLIENIAIAVIDEEIERMGIKSKLYEFLNKLIPNKLLNSIVRSNLAYIGFTVLTKLIAFADTVQIPPEQKVFVLVLGFGADFAKFGQKYLFEKADKNKDGKVDNNDLSEDVKKFLHTDLKHS